MNPSILISLMLVAGTAGGLFYTYHLGRTQEIKICEAEKLEKQLAQTKLQLEVEKDMTQLQLDQIGEAQEKLKKETLLNAQLQEDLNKALAAKSSEPVGCITPGMRDAIKKYRGSTNN